MKLTYLLFIQFRITRMLLWWSIWLNGAFAFGQVTPQDSIPAYFTEYTRKAWQEKIFVHTDKAFYVAGETVWFKLYHQHASTHEPMLLTKAAYVEIMNDQQQAVLQAKIPLKDGTGNGSFILPFTLISGSYKLRAYTSWMKNFSPDFYFEKDLTLVNSLTVLPPTASKAAPAYHVQFFPEGGNLVQGLRSKVAFKFSNGQGKGIDGTGAVLNQHNDTIITFRPLKQGMGHFWFTPLSDQTYRAVVKSSDGKQIQSEFPRIFEQGYVLTLEEAGEEELRIYVQATVPATAIDSVYLFSHTRQAIKTGEMQLLRDGKATFKIATSKLGEGISHLTLFNSKRLPVCERLYFKHPQQRLHIKAGTDQNQYASRKKVIVDILTTTQPGEPAMADMSMSVYLLDSLQQPEQADIFSYLWLKADLQGNIENPQYYLSDTSPEATQALDNLMLTHGWRRFRWEDIWQQKSPVFEFQPEQEGHIISGLITDTRSTLPAGNITAYLSVPGKRLQVYGASSDRHGKLRFYTKDMLGPQELVIQTNTQKDSLYRIEIESPFSSKFSNHPFPPFAIASTMSGLLADQSVSMQVQNIFSPEQRNRFRPVRMDTTVFYNTPDRTYRLDDFTRFPTIEEVVREYMPEVAIRKRNGKRAILVSDLANQMIFEQEPLILLDGLPVFNTEKFLAYDPLKIQKLEVVARRYFWGPLIVEGILNFSTYTHNLSGFELDPQSVIMEYEGLQLQREFYAPVYENETQHNSRLPDLRNVLFWSPEIHTDASGKKQLSFYTSDQPGKYIGVIQGISPTGEAASQTFTFEVGNSQ
ncbi:hypothetical protein GXP67_02105 [Rhodocytophaga rosea]|uniref:Macroglobulin domain-containing protein n=1 Tax=Rhodocytophaga rosea TaxID=2704465 RepID=A0A6C0GCJ8_9BACT|nr:hypothetical protein [Rhodocytophaga rosea]QHT65543.1 hypothetical protein GXP67_02105 [Rhodocytophaga rosea]